jgi:ATP synthase protein I
MSGDRDPHREPSPLDALGDRIEAMRAARAPKRSRANEEVSAVAFAWRMVLDLTVGVLVGGAAGWGIDAALGTLPLFLIVFGLLGFAAGVRTMLRSAAELNRRADRARATDGGEG